MPKRILQILFLVGVLLIPTLSLADLRAGVDAYERGDYESARKEFRSLANQGNADAQWRLGSMYDDGDGVPEDDAEAAKWYRLAADQGNPLGQFFLGNMYDLGEGVSQDYAEAAKLYRLAADQGFDAAQGYLGLLYTLGKGVPRDYVLAYMWSKLAADQGNEGGLDLLNRAETKMTAEQIAEAQRLAREWKPKGK